MYRGVVQLFNLVKQQQRTVEKKLKNVGPSILKQDKVLESLDKKSFIDSIDHRKVSTYLNIFISGDQTVDERDLPHGLFV